MKEIKDTWKTRDVQLKQKIYDKGNQTLICTLFFESAPQKVSEFSTFFPFEKNDSHLICGATLWRFIPFHFALYNLTERYYTS